jgi:Fur family ferric uptake transcriptional regulator
MPRSRPDNINDIHSSGLRATVPRLKVLDVFQQSATRHLSAEDIFKILLKDGLDVSLATVYRVLMQFVEAGLLARNQFESGKALFELKEGPDHDHLVCLRCGQVQEFFDEAIVRRQQEITAQRGFELRDHALALYGLCAGCAASAASKARLRP